MIRIMIIIITIKIMIIIITMTIINIIKIITIIINTPQSPPSTTAQPVLSVKVRQIRRWWIIDMIEWINDKSAPRAAEKSWLSWAHSRLPELAKGHVNSEPEKKTNARKLVKVEDLI